MRRRNEVEFKFGEIKACKGIVDKNTDEDEDEDERK